MGTKTLPTRFFVPSPLSLLTTLCVLPTRPMPLCFADGANIAKVSLKGVAQPVFDARQSQMLVDMYAGHRLAPTVAKGSSCDKKIDKAMRDEMEQANRGAISAKVSNSKSNACRVCARSVSPRLHRCR